jgi:hypothetical protein
MVGDGEGMMGRKPLLALMTVALVLAVGCSVNPVTGKSQLDLVGEVGAEAARRFRTLG